ncbi:hypothetical protein [Bacillus taeanensis]|nr:hypothetical protein [Bacillus taeanensis]
MCVTSILEVFVKNKAGKNESAGISENGYQPLGADRVTLSIQ